MLIFNALTVVRSLPRKIRRSLLEFFGRSRSLGSSSSNVEATSRLLCVPPNLVKSVASGIKIEEGTGARAPVPPKASAKRAQCATAGDDAAFSGRSALDAFVNLTRAALGVVADGGGERDYVAECARLVEVRADVGEKYHSREYFRDVVFLAARLVQAQDAADLCSTPLKALGTPGFISLSFDVIPIGGKTAFGRHGSVLVICGKAASPHTGRLHYRLMAFETLREGHGGDAIAKAVFGALGHRPWCFSDAELKRVLSSIWGTGR